MCTLYSYLCVYGFYLENANSKVTVYWACMIDLFVYSTVLPDVGIYQVLGHKQCPQFYFRYNNDFMHIIS